MMLARGQPTCFFFYIIMRKQLYISKIFRIFAVAKIKAEDNADIASPLKSAIEIRLQKLFYMNDKKKHRKRCFCIAVRKFRDFSHIGQL